MLQSLEDLEDRNQKVDDALAAARQERASNAKKNADLLAKQKVSNGLCLPRAPDCYAVLCLLHFVCCAVLCYALAVTICCCAVLCLLRAVCCAVLWGGVVWCAGVCGANF